MPLRYLKLTAISFIFFFVCIAYQACEEDTLLSGDDVVLAKQKISEYGIYQGKPSDLQPTGDYKLYELSSELFSDYAEKQRLIKLPPGTSLKATGNGLPQFPEGTIIVKTFYYFNDKRSPAKGKKLIETRVLQLMNARWTAGTYLWNGTQTEAFLIGTGLEKTMNWIDQSGNAKVISYHVPSNLECKTCHYSNKTTLPIGPKVRNLNFNVVRNNASLNQLRHLQEEGILSTMNPAEYSSLPNYLDPAKTLEERGRAYLDINCAHCHTENGFANNIRYRMDYETAVGHSKIKEGKAVINFMLENGDMPKIGTTVIDTEGVELVRRYLETL